ncbi:MAG TPA: TadE/TadG family type IV pilus assembly protein [Caulobacteraceae bacterium]
MTGRGGTGGGGTGRGAKRRRAFAWRRLDSSGATAVEFAIILPILSTFIYGIFQLGWGIFCGNDVRHAIERAARIYITTPTATDTQFTSAVTSNLTTVDIHSVGITVTKPTAAGAQMAQITWTYTYPLVIPFVPTMTLNFGSHIVVPVRPG